MESTGTQTSKVEEIIQALVDRVEVLATELGLGLFAGLTDAEARAVVKGTIETIIARLTSRGKASEEAQAAFEQVCPLASMTGCPDAAIRRLLLDLGVPPHYTGYRYLVTALRLVLREPESITWGRVMQLYQKISEVWPDDSPERIERDIRHCITTIWEFGPLPLLQQTFGHQRPTNAAFLARLGEKLRLDFARA